MGSAWEWAAGVRRWAGGVDWRSAGQAALEIGVGFTPLGVGYDLYNIARSAREVYRGEEGAAANLLMDSLGLLPGGDLLKVGRRFKRAADIADGLSDAARRLPASKFGTPGTFMVLEHSARTTPDQLRRKAGWLDGAARAGEARLTRSTRGVRTGGPQRRARAAGAIAPGHHADHMLDLQLGGADHIDNIASLHGGTNMSVGSQLRGQFGDLPDGTAVSRVFLQEPQGAPVVKAIEALGPGKALK